VVLYPGAGTSSEHPSLITAESVLRGGVHDHRSVDDLAPIAGVDVRRVDFAYRRNGRRAPDRAPVLVAEVLALAEDLRAEHPGRPLVFGGRSMGGRMCTMAAAERPGVIDALACVCYPLHPPGKPESLRVAHFGSITVPILFVSGTKDPFGSPDELTAHTGAISGAVTHVWVEGKGHDLKGADVVVGAAISRWLASV
jgi:uncharacterized protein